MKEQKDLSGVLFVNKKKDENHPNWPDREGSCMVNGVEYWVSGWIKNGSNGQFLSLAFKPKTAEKLDGKRAGERPKTNDNDRPW